MSFQSWHGFMPVAASADYIARTETELGGVRIEPGFRFQVSMPGLNALFWVEQRLPKRYRKRWGWALLYRWLAFVAASAIHDKGLKDGLTWSHAALLFGLALILRGVNPNFAAFVVILVLIWGVIRAPFVLFYTAFLKSDHVG